MKSLQQRSFLRLCDFSHYEINYLLDAAAFFKQAKKDGTEKQYLKDKNIILLFEKESTRTRCAFDIASLDQGATVTYISPESSPMGRKESMKDTARVLGRMYDGIEYRGFSERAINTLAEYSGVPVWNGLTNHSHPTQALADLLTMREHSHKVLKDLKVCYVGNARNNVCNSLMIGCLKMGVDFRIAAPSALSPTKEVLALANEAKKELGGKLTITENISEAIKGCDFLYTDVWVSMGEKSELWDERIELLLPYKITSETMKATGNHHCKFMHCLPSYHNTDTIIGAEICKRYNLTEMEVTDEVFESKNSIVFDQAENRMHTIKAVMVSTLGSED